MNSIQKIKQLRDLIEKTLDPLVDRDYVFLDLPYHPNVGDTLISMAAKNYLRRFKYKCLYYSSEFTFDDRPISPDTLIIFNGGGNFGDLWKNYTDFRNKLIKKYPQNHFLILPQSVMYSDKANLIEDINVYSASPNITICARDEMSYNFLKGHFTRNNVQLVPDMAFYSDDSLLHPNTAKTGRILFLRRKDKEFVDTPQYSLVPETAEKHDWPTMETMTRPYWVLYYVKKIVNILETKGYKKSAWKLLDLYWQKILHPYNIKSGFSFVDSFDEVYTTRLHVAVISVLLGKKTYFFDNSYHKNKALYETWLNDVDNIEFIDC